MKIKELRRLTGLTQAEFAEKLGCPLKTVQRWETRNEPLPYVARLIEYYLLHEGIINDK